MICFACRVLILFMGRVILQNSVSSSSIKMLQRYSGIRSRRKEIAVAVLFVAFLVLSSLAVVAIDSFSDGLRSFFRFQNQEQNQQPRNQSLEEILEKAALPNKTVIIASLNAAWAENNSMIDLFLESFQEGNSTKSLLKHLIIVAFDQKAFCRCREIHVHCWKIETPGVDFSQEKVYMTEDFVKMVWRRIQFLETVLEKGYSFLFTDADILWLRDPFVQLEKLAGADHEQVDMAIASDFFNGNASDAVGNFLNSGLIYARATNRTSKVYSYWYEARERYPGMKEQDVLSSIMSEEGFMAIGARLRFLDTHFFAGFCSISSSDVSTVVTMHANCCKGLRAKLSDLRVVLHSWKNYLAHPPNSPPPFQRPFLCPLSWE